MQLKHVYSILILRLVLALSFLGHGLVSLALSPSVSLHQKFISLVNFTTISNDNLVLAHAVFDILVALLLTINIKLRQLVIAVISYLILVSLVAMAYYFNQTNSIFGFAELFRRLPWVFFAVLILHLLKSKESYYLLRIGLSFAFIAHGLASLGFFGLSQGHIDLALNIIPQEKAASFVFYSGISDTIIGLLLFFGILTRYVSILSIIWIAFIVYLSYLTAFPDAIFRSALLLAAIYLLIEKRAHGFLFSTPNNK